MRWGFGSLLVCAGGLGACGDDAPPPLTASETEVSSTSGTSFDTQGTAGERDIYRFANGCYALQSSDTWLRDQGEAFVFSAEREQASRFFMKPSALGTYLFYDQDGGYLVAEEGPLLRQTTLNSDVSLVDDDYVSGAEWELEQSALDPAGYQLRSRRSGRLLGTAELVATQSEGAVLRLVDAEGCREHPELSIDAVGVVEPRTFEDGSVYGIVDAHSHILSNFGFGGGGIFHGSAFHPLGVEHALPDCELYHGVAGRKDFFGFAFDSAGADGVDLGGVLPRLLVGELEEDNHATAGYPEFTDWPNAPTRSTHQTQYYRWLQRAYMAGLRLVVQHATTNAVICQMMAGQGIQPTRYACDDMVAVDRILEETYAMERYIDAQMGGPGRGWFRIVLSAEEAREVVASGKLAVVLGIETSNLFECVLAPGEDDPVCDENYVVEQLDDYYQRGVRVLFPVHKYDNAFSAGDGDRAFIELGNFFNSGHWSNFTESGCPAGVPTVFDEGNVTFGGLNMPRDAYASPPPNDFSDFASNPLGTAIEYLSQIQAPGLEGDYCQNAGLTALGETLLTEMMARGMLIEIDHFPRRSYEQVFAMLEARDYPAAGTHGTNYDGRVYALGGISKTNFGRCRDPMRAGAMMDSFNDRFALNAQNGGLGVEGFGFDLNGFAGAPGPRFAEGACPTTQEGPVAYPFTSYAGDVTFTQPFVGNREIDFNLEGLVHIGLLPELLEDVRADAASDAELEPLFRSAEGYLRMWEKAEARARAFGGR